MNLHRVRRVLANLVAIGGAVGLVTLGGYALGLRRHSQDVTSCRKAIPTMALMRGHLVPIPASTLRQEYSSCVKIRRSERGFLGAVWKTGGQAMAGCNIEWGRFQQLDGFDDRPAADAVIAAYGISDPLDPGSMTDKNRFMTTCLARGSHLLDPHSRPNP